MTTISAEFGEKKVIVLKRNDIIILNSAKI
jgi:hypothetical protein